MTPIEAGHKIKSITGVTPRIEAGTSLATNKFVADIFKLEKEMADKDPDYDPNKCTYKGKPNYSFKMYIQEKWGDTMVYYVSICCGIKI